MFFVQSTSETAATAAQRRSMGAAAPCRTEQSRRRPPQRQSLGRCAENGSLAPAQCASTPGMPTIPATSGIADRSDKSPHAEAEIPPALLRRRAQRHGAHSREKSPAKHGRETATHRDVLQRPFTAERSKEDLAIRRPHAPGRICFAVDRQFDVGMLLAKRRQSGRKP